MKKIIFSVVCGALTMLLAPSCGHGDGDDLAIPAEQTTATEQPAIVNEPSAKVWHVTLKAKTAPNGISKALTGDYDDGFKGQFAKDEKVYAFKYEEDGGFSKVGELTAQSSGATTTFEGDFTSPVAVGDGLELRYLSADFDYSGQDGTLASACAHFYAIAKVNVTDVTADGDAASEVSLTEATFNFCSSMVKFSLQDATAHEFTINDGTNIITVTPADATNELYISLPPSSGKIPYTLTAYNGTTSICVIKQYELECNKYYSAKVTFFKAVGKFTINANGDQVSFSKGNLQYNVNTNVWRFAVNQYDYVGDDTKGNVMEGETSCTNNNIQGPWIDLFGWVGESGSLANDDVTKYGVSTQTDLHCYGYKNESLKSDWGNVTGSGSVWRTLTIAEWQYLFNTRENHDNLFGNGTVDGVKGRIILPDGWQLPSVEGLDLSFTPSTSNSYDVNQWKAMEESGAVFLANAGKRNGSSISDVGSLGYYWSSSPQGGNAYYVYQNSTTDYRSRDFGLSVRLVRSLE